MPATCPRMKVHARPGSPASTTTLRPRNVNISSEANFTCIFYVHCEMCAVVGTKLIKCTLSIVMEAAKETSTDSAQKKNAKKRVVNNSTSHAAPLEDKLSSLLVH